MIPSAYDCSDELDGLVYLAEPMGRITPPDALQDYDPISGPTHRDDAYPVGRTHGRTRENVSTGQTPLPLNMRGGPPGISFAHNPAQMAMGGDVAGTVSRGQRYPAIAHIPPESGGTIGRMARQSYQFVRDLVPYPYPSNAFGYPNIGGEVRQIDQTVPPALEGPRYDNTGMDTDYLQQQHDTMLLKQMLAERGM